MGRAQGKDGKPIDVEVSVEVAPSVVWDAMVVVDGESAVEALSNSGQVLEFLQDQYRHCKPILLLGAARNLLEAVGIESQLPSGETDPGLLLFEGNALKAAAVAFAESLAKHRHFQRETDPPRI